MQTTVGSTWLRLPPLFLAVVIAVAVVGYFVGLADGVPQPDGLQEAPFTSVDHAPKHPSAKIIAAVSYAEVPHTPMGPTAAWQATSHALPQQAYDLYAEVKPSPEEKKRSADIRASRRAFNGAPPIIPHAVEGTNDAACYSCHGQGTQFGGVKASVMSHGFLANCTQCHALPPPSPFQEVDSSVASTFVGLPAPTQGERAYPGAPPTIPHSRWMRDNCSACHGGPNGWAGMESTHPWRTNCTQCHAPSAVLDQAIVAPGKVPMLPSLEIE